MCICWFYKQPVNIYTIYISHQYLIFSKFKEHKIYNKNWIWSIYEL